VNRFAELLDALLFTPSRNGKLRLMQEYFATNPDPERGWALAALTGELSFAEAKPSQVRDLAMARVDPELFGWSWDFVGDLAETVALIWPEPAHHPDPSPHPDPPPLAEEGVMAAGVPTLSEIVATLQGASRAEVGAHLAPWLDRPLGLAEAGDRSAEDRGLGAARQDRTRRMERRGARPYRGSLARPRAALPRTVRLAGGAGRAA
jgi:DNA ligase-1